LASICVAGFGQSRIDSLIGVLKTEIREQDVFVGQKLQRIEKLHDRKAETGPTDYLAWLDIYNGLYHEYKTFVNDSAFRYARKLSELSRQLNDSARTGYSHLKLGFTLLSGGMFKETFDTLRAINVK